MIIQNIVLSGSAPNLIRKNKNVYAISNRILYICRFFFAFKIKEKTLIPPSFLFIIAYFSSSYLYPYSLWILEERYSTIAYGNFNITLWLATYSFFALLLGYILSPTRSAKKIKKNKPCNNYLIGKSSTSLIVIILIIMIILYVINSPLIMGASIVRGENSYIQIGEQGILYKVFFITSQVINPFILAIFIATHFNKTAETLLLRKLSIIAMIFIISITLLSFDRHAAVTLILYFSVFYHYRVRKIKLKYFLLIFLVIFLLQIFRSTRNLGLPFSEIDIFMIIESITSISIIDTLIGIFTAIAGWGVFTNVVNIVPLQDGYKYGATYLESLIGLFNPRILGFSTIETPSFWYVKMYAPGTTNHGFDFSMLAEAYMNFGIFMPIFFFVVGIYLGWLSKNIRTSQSYFLILFSIIALESMTFALRMDSNSWFKATIFKFLVVYLIFILIKKIIRIRR